MDKLLATTSDAERSRLLSSNESAVAEAQKAWEKANQAYELAEAGDVLIIDHETGSYTVSPDHDLAVQSAKSYRPVVNRLAAELDKAARIAESNAREVIRDSAAAAPSLTDAELDQAASRTALFEAEARNLPLGQLRDRVLADVRAGHKPAIYNWLVHAGHRLETNPPKPGQMGLDPKLADAVRDLQHALSAGKALLAPPESELSKKASRVRNAAQDAKSAAAKAERRRPGIRYSWQDKTDVLRDSE